MIELLQNFLLPVLYSSSLLWRWIGWPQPQMPLLICLLAGQPSELPCPGTFVVEEKGKVAGFLRSSCLSEVRCGHHLV